jgi:oxepin-CoA hydrolase/3-oxo-5,6-dehydrosuberyl-CoA semialdehyde dehydrogenase
MAVAEKRGDSFVMKTIRSYVAGDWFEAGEGHAELVDPATEEAVARASSRGIDFEAVLAHARGRGGPALRELDFAARAGLLSQMSKRLHEHRDELIALSMKNTGVTRKDAKFDVDGGTFTLAYYAGLGREMGDGRWATDGEGVQLGRTARFWGQHVWVPLTGAAVHINAFNFPVWGFAEKAACSLLAGMATITKPATSTCWVTERCVEIVVESGILPDGALSLICGSTGDLLDRLGPQDVLAFTGSASTALGLRGKKNLLEMSTHVNIEADSLNAAVLGADVEPSAETWSVFVREVVREMTQKTGQKCTAVRRILVPRDRVDDVRAALVEQLSETVTGNPQDSSVTMGPLATAAQLEEAVSGVARLAEEAEIVLGNGKRIDGVGSPEGRGYFFGPTLLCVRDGHAATAVHRHEVFGPVATLVPYDGTARDAATLVARGEGSLVTSLYSDDPGFVGEYLVHGGSTSGRLYVGSEKVAGQLPGSGLALPQVLHGGPGRAGGGEELAAERGLSLYRQRVALTGDKTMIERVLGGAKG